MALTSTRVHLSEIQLLDHVADEVFDDGINPNSAKGFLTEDRNILIMPWMTVAEIVGMTP